MRDSHCHVHAEVAAVASCRECSAALCEACCKLVGIVPYCGRCVPKTRRRSLAGPIVGLVILGAAGGGGYWAYRTYKAPFDHGARTGEIEKLAGQLGNEPCDHPKQLELLQHLLASGDNRAVLDRAAAFAEKCGDEPKMCASTYLAHKRLGEIEKALADLDRLITTSPSSPYPFAWRAAIREERGELDLAIADLQKAWSLYPAATDIPMNLATLYERQGKPCEAIVPLQQLLMRYSSEPFTAGARARLTFLEEQGACRVTVTGSNTVTVRRIRSGMFLTDALLGDKTTAKVFVDTGASFLTVVRPVAEKLGVDLVHAPKVKVGTANGQRDALFVFIPKVAVGGLSTANVPALVVDDLGPGVEGLLGQSFLSRFELKQAGETMEITPKRRPGAAPTP